MTPQQRESQSPVTMVPAGPSTYRQPCSKQSFLNPNGTAGSLTCLCFRSSTTYNPPQPAHPGCPPSSAPLFEVRPVIRFDADSSADFQNPVISATFTRLLL
ncbi:hypothetical protein Vafri_11296 [Volvox africanus]|nr:hypothetical protein Vafri_11296 [Volvox africanus]